MNKKFKRLISVILTVMMAIGMMPFSGLTTVSAATLTSGSTIYFNTNGNTTFTKDGAVPSVIFKSKDSNDALSGWVTMTLVSGNVYSATVPVSGASYVQFRRSSSTGANWNSGTKNLAVVSGKDMFKITSWSNSSWNNSTGSWSTYSGGSGGGGTTTGTFNVNADLVDYFNNGRVEQPDNTLYNQGLETGSDKAPYSKFNQWLTETTAYSNPTTKSKDPVPLYFGDLYHKSQAGSVALKWYWQGANLAFGNDSNAVARGIVADHLSANGELLASYGTESNPIKMPFFEENAYTGQSTYMKFYKNLQFPFTATTQDGVTKYSFDSEKNTVYYDYTNKKLVRNDSIAIYDWADNGTHNSQGTRGYFPFNSSNPSNHNDLNFGFGTKFTIPFTINTDGKDANGKDVTFNFTGDDDVWVYIDGALVLDMGGGHYKASGNINFATGKSSVTSGSGDARTGNISSGWPAGNCSPAITKPYETKFENITVKLADGTTCSLKEHMAKEGEVHTLTMYYMERGMWNSNMSIDFSFIPLPSGLSLSKDVNVEQVNAGLQEDARIQDNFDFKIDDGDNSKEYNYVLDFNGDGVTDPITTTNRVVTGVSDNAYAKDFKYASGTETGLKLGTNFTITETVDSTKYSTRWFVTDLKTSSSTPVAQDTTTVAKFKLGEADPDNPFATASYNVNFINTMKVGTVAVKKAWGAGTAPTDTEFDFKVEVDLSGTGNTYQVYALDYTSSDISRNGTTGADGSFKIKAGETVSFAGIPVGAKVKVTETTTSGDSWTVDGEAFKESSALTEGSSVLLTITNKTNSVDVNKVIYVEAGKTTTYTPNDVTFTGASLTSVSSSTTATAAVNGKGLDISVKDADRKCIFKIEGTDSTGANLSSNSTLTVYSYKATDKVYVFDYGLKSDISKTNTNGDGLFQGGVFYNTEAQKVTTDKTSAYLDVNGFAAKAGATNDQTSIAFEGTANQIVYNTQSQAYELNAGNSVIFTPLKFMDKVEEYTYKANVLADSYTGSADDWDSTNPETGTVVNGTIKVMPASVVYYEDNFNATGAEDSSVKIVYTGDSEDIATAGTSLELTQSNGQTEQYGHDDAYNTVDNQKDSGGSSTKLTADGYKTKATFTFTGTGFDILARTTTDTAGIVYTIEKKNETTGNFEMFRMGAVDTYYVNGDLYQLPVIHEDMDYGTYTVTLGIKQTGTLQTTYDENGNVIGTVDTRKYVVYLDGVRIYNPLGTDGDSAYIANEKDVTVSEIPGLVVGNGTVTEKGIIDEDGTTIINSQVIDGATAVIASYSSDDNSLAPLGTTQTEVATGTSSAGTDSILTYLNAGPNNELYLDETAALAFVVKSTNTTNTLQIEAKLVDTQNSSASQSSSGLALRVLSNKSGSVAEKAIDTIKSSTAMYYNIPVEDCISLGNDYYLVVILGNSDFEDGGTHSLSFSNLKSKNYTIGTPYDTTTYDASDYLAADPEGASDFVSVNLATGLKKNTWQSYDNNSVTLTKDVFGENAPEFAMYYVNAKGEKVKLTVYAQKADNNTYKLRFKTPNAKGNFPVEIHYVVDSVESTDYIATTLKVVK